jgi:hypothetical protein
MIRNCLLAFTPILIAFSVSAQSKRQKPEPVREDFCLRMDKIFAAEVKGFEGFADSSNTESVVQNRRPVRKEYAFDQATCELVTLPTGQTVYRAIFMSRSSKESVVASYKNLLAMVKECYQEDYIFTDKTSKLRKVYECRGVPYDIDVNKEQPEVVVYISEDWVNQVYQLVLQVD